MKLLRRFFFLLKKKRRFYAQKGQNTEGVSAAAQGNVLAIYQKKDNNFTWKEQHLYGSSRLGIFAPEVKIQGVYVLDVAALKQSVRTYELTNHLGNVLSTITDKGVITSAQDYFPFGLTLASRSFTEGGSVYRYSFNGKEDDKETGFQDYGLRLYFKNLGRFPTVDPLAKKYPFYSPYQFAGNMPIKYVDLDGAEPAEAPISGSTYTVAKKQGTEETYGWSPMIDKAKNALVWAQGGRVDYERGAVTNPDRDLNFADRPPYPSETAKSKDEKITNAGLELYFRNSFWAGTTWTNENDGMTIYEHFRTGGGAELNFQNGSGISTEIANDDRFKGFATQFEDAAVSYFRTHGNLNDFNGNTTLPPLFDLSGMRNNLFLATTIGGVQNIRATITSITVTNSGGIVASFHYSVRDAFGAGTTDGMRDGNTPFPGRPHGQFFPGLVDMYVLQHYRNVQNNSIYRPFILNIHVDRVRGY